MYRGWHAGRPLLGRVRWQTHDHGDRLRHHGFVHVDRGRRGFGTSTYGRRRSTSSGCVLLYLGLHIWSHELVLCLDLFGGDPFGAPQDLWTDILDLGCLHLRLRLQLLDPVYAESIVWKHGNQCRLLLLWNRLGLLCVCNLLCARNSTTHFRTNR